MALAQALPNNVLVHVGTSKTGGVALQNNEIVQLSIVSPAVFSKACTAQIFAFLLVPTIGFILFGSISSPSTGLQVTPTGVDVKSIILL